MKRENIKRVNEIDRQLNNLEKSIETLQECIETGVERANVYIGTVTGREDYVHLDPEIMKDVLERALEKNKHSQKMLEKELESL